LSGTNYSGQYTNTEAKSARWDMRPQLLKQFETNAKALNTQTGGAGSTDLTLVPIYLDPVIVDESRKWTPLVELWPRVTNMGLTADYNVITAKGAAFFAAEDDVLNENNDTYERRSKPIKYMYSVGRVTQQAQAAIPSFMLQGFQPGGVGAPTGTMGDVNAPNANQLEILMKTRSMKELEEDKLLNGSVAADPNEFDGIIIQIAGVNDINLAGAAIALNDIHRVVRAAYDDGGRPNLGICNSAQYEELLKLLSTQITFREATRQVFWGFSAIVFYTMVGELPMIPSQFLSNATDVGRVIVLDLSVCEMRVLQDLTYMPLARTNDSDKFVLKQYLVPIIRAPQFCAQIINADQV